MTTEAISSGQTSVQAELRRTANTRKYLKYQAVFIHLFLTSLIYSFPAVLYWLLIQGVIYLCLSGLKL